MVELDKLLSSGAVEEVVFVDINNNRVSTPPGTDDLHLLPPCFVEPLRQAIDNTSKLVKQKYEKFNVREVLGTLGTLRKNKRYTYYIHMYTILYT